MRYEIWKGGQRTVNLGTYRILWRRPLKKIQLGFYNLRIFDLLGINYQLINMFFSEEFIKPRQYLIKYLYGERKSERK